MAQFIVNEGTVVWWTWQKWSLLFNWISVEHWVVIICMWESDMHFSCWQQRKISIPSPVRTRSRNIWSTTTIQCSLEPHLPSSRSIILSRLLCCALGMPLSLTWHVSDLPYHPFFCDYLPVPFSGRWLPLHELCWLMPVKEGLCLATAPSMFALWHLCLGKHCSF